MIPGATVSAPLAGHRVGDGGEVHAVHRGSGSGAGAGHAGGGQGNHNSAGHSLRMTLSGASDMSGRAMGGPTSHLIDTLFDAYGKPTEQVGYTDGHYCLTKHDREEAARSGSSLLYGEILASGVSKLLDDDHLRASKAQVLYDLGMGVGKLCLQAFLQFPSLRLVFGIELAFSRYKMAEEALLRLASIQPESFEVEEHEPGECIRVHTVGARRAPRRVIELRRGNMWTVRGVNAVDIVVLHTELTVSSLPRVRRMIAEMRQGARFVTYQDLSKQQWYEAAPTPPFRQLEVNISESDQFATSWSAVKGHHLYCWEKTTPPTPMHTMDDDREIEESKEGVAPR